MCGTIVPFPRAAPSITLASAPARADYQQKGANIQATYAADKARASGKSSSEAEAITAATYRRVTKAKPSQARPLTEDELKVQAFREANKDIKDEWGRPIF